MKQMATQSKGVGGQPNIGNRSRSRSAGRTGEKKSEDGRKSTGDVKDEKNGRLSKPRSVASSKHESRSGRDVNCLNDLVVSFNLWYLLYSGRLQGEDADQGRKKVNINGLIQKAIVIY